MVPYSRGTMHDVSAILYEYFKDCNGVRIGRSGGVLEIEVPNNTALKNALNRYGVQSG